MIEGASVSLDDPIQLLPVEIPKPWGREIWYTGMEARGDSRVGSETASLPLRTYLTLDGGRATGGVEPVLLKILDPRPEPLLGELYLEVHQEKQEVYVVTAVDHSTWPDGKGRIRYGINQTLRRTYDSDSAFRKDFLEALNRYETVRGQIDAGAVGLAEAEKLAREATLTFTDELFLEVGDVVCVPTWVPHSLQQGVRVVEFQTPTYERFILSSSQKVLTQDRWDSALAVERMQLDPPAANSPEKLGRHVERIVQFEEFGVWRATLGTTETLQLPAGLPYALAFCVTGRMTLTGRQTTLELEAGQAAMIPAASVDQAVTGAPGSLILLAAPGL